MILKKDIGILFTLSFFSVVAWFLFQDISLTPDSETYIQLSEYLVGKRILSTNLLSKTPGYSLLMILGGVPFLDSLYGLLFIQAIMAILTPIVIYKILLSVTPKKAFIGALLSIFTLIPVIYSKTLLTEQASIFLSLSLIYLVALYQNTGKPRYLYSITFLAIFLAFLNPATNLMVFIILAFCLYFYIKNFKHIAMCIMIFLCSIFLWSTWTNLYTNPQFSGSVKNRIHQMLSPHLHAENKPAFPFLKNLFFNSLISFPGQQLFYQAYVAAPYSLTSGGRTAFFTLKNFEEQKAPHVYQLFSIIKNSLHEHPEFWETKEPYSSFAIYKGQPDTMMEESIIMHPNIHTYWFMWDVVSTLYGPVEASKIFIGAALEMFLQVPHTIVLFSDNLISFFFGPTSTFNSGVRKISLPFFLPSQNHHDNNDSIALQNNNTAIKLFWGWLWLILKPILFLSIIVTFLFLWKKRSFALNLMILSIILYHAIVVSVFAGDAPRFIDQIILLALIVAINSVTSFAQWLKNDHAE